MAMNKMLVEAVSMINALLAVLFIGGGAIAGLDYAGGGGLFVGLLVGFLVAVAVCGILAIFIEIRNELISIRLALGGSSKPK